MFSLRGRKIDFMVRGLVVAAFLPFLSIAALAQNQPAGGPASTDNECSLRQRAISITDDAVFKPDTMMAFGGAKRTVTYITVNCSIVKVFTRVFGQDGCNVIPDPCWTESTRKLAPNEIAELDKQEFPPSSEDSKQETSFMFPGVGRPLSPANFSMTIKRPDDGTLFDKLSSLDTYSTSYSGPANERTLPKSIKAIFDILVAQPPRGQTEAPPR